MPRFIVKVASEARVWQEECWAKDEEEVRKLYEKKGFAVLRIRKKRGEIRFSRPKISWKDRIIFTQEFLALTKAGMPFIKSLELIMRKARNPRLMEILAAAKERILDGADLSVAFKPYSEDLGVLFVTSLAAGERSGKIEYTLQKYLDYAIFMDSISSRVKSALIYPAVVISVSLFLVFLLTTFVIPRFANFYQGANLSLPWITTIILSISAFMKKYWIYILILLFLLYLGYKNASKLKGLYFALEKFKLSLPVLGEGIILISASIYFRTLSFLLGGGIPIANSTMVAASASPNGYIREKLSIVSEKIKEGENLTDTLESLGLFPDMGIEMVRVGENSGQLESLLIQAADFIEREFEFKIKRWLSILEPLTILLLGIIVGIMLLSVYLPIFQLARGIR
ncbi:MAG: type II secretion system F family protein [Candidatus Aminicenantes bacterium]|nr:type II secretion system F family protein [Candidatus Aminicenantes bacterium]